MMHTQGLGDQFAKASGQGQKKSEKRSRALPLKVSCFDLCWIVLLLVSSFIIQPIVLAFHYVHVICCTTSLSLLLIATFVHALMAFILLSHASSKKK